MGYDNVVITKIYDLTHIRVDVTPQCNVIFNPNHMGWGKLSHGTQNFVKSARVLTIIALIE